MDLFRGVLTAFVFTLFLVLLFLGGFVLGKAYGQEPVPEQWDQTFAWHSSTATDVIRLGHSI